MIFVPSILWILTSLLIYFKIIKDDKDFRALKKNKRILYTIIGLSPLNIPIILVVSIMISWTEFLRDFISDYIIDPIDDGLIEPIVDKFKRKRELKRRTENERKIREDKIKRGIIRITPLDPYGEENWIEDDKFTEIKYGPLNNDPWDYVHFNNNRWDN